MTHTINLRMTPVVNAAAPGQVDSTLATHFTDETQVYQVVEQDHEQAQQWFTQTPSLNYVINGHIPAAVQWSEQHAPLHVAVPIPLSGETHRIQPAAQPILKALIFDVDGTLVDSLRAYFAVAEEAVAPYGYSVQWPIIREALNQNTLDFWELIVPQDVPDRAARMTTIQQRSRDLWPDILANRVTLMPTTTTLIDTLIDRGIQMGVVTSSGGGSMKPMNEAGLTDHLACVVTRHDVNQRKPDPEGILKVLAAMDVSPSNAAYVGDSIMDIRAAHNAGVTAVGVLCGSGDNASLTAEQPHFLFKDASQVVQLLG